MDAGLFCAAWPEQRLDRWLERLRGDRPFVFTNLKVGGGLETVVDFILSTGGLLESSGAGAI